MHLQLLQNCLTFSTIEFWSKVKQILSLLSQMQASYHHTHHSRCYLLRAIFSKRMVFSILLCYYSMYNNSYVQHVQLKGKKRDGNFIVFHFASQKIFPSDNISAKNCQSFRLDATKPWFRQDAKYVSGLQTITKSFVIIAFLFLIFFRNFLPFFLKRHHI